MTMNATSLRNDVTRVADQLQAANGLAIVRLTIGAMFVWVFFENLGKGLYHPAGYASLINYYIKATHTAAPVVPVVVMNESACEYRSSFLPITKRRPLAVCLPICLPIWSRKSSLSTAIRLTERPISRKRWEHKSSRSLAEDTGALV